MKVYIGPYVDWVGPYQIADLGRFVGLNEDQCFKFGKYLNGTFVGKICRWCYGRKSRKSRIRIDDYDVWNADDTLSLIIYPLLCKFDRETFSCNVDDEDVPDHLKSTVMPAKIQYDLDENYFERSKWLLDELCWTFNVLSSDDPDRDVEFSSGNSHFETGPPDENGNCELKLTGDYKFDRVASDKHRARIDNGLRLFGKYYRGLWT